MNKLELDLSKYRYELRENRIYEAIIKDIFKYNRQVRVMEDKKALVQELTTRLPIKVVGDVEKIRIKTIINVVNMLMVHSEKELTYESKKVYTVRHGKQIYSTAYTFKFIDKE